MPWLLIVIIAYLLNATATVIDKFLLIKKIPNPAVYTFFVCALSLIALLFIPFGFETGDPTSIVIALMSGLFFTAAIFYMFKSLGYGEISRLGPFIGGLQPIFILAFANFVLGEWPATQAIIGIAVIVIGTLAISWQKDKLAREAFGFALAASFLFAISYILSKEVFNLQGFISGLIWTRIGAFLGAGALLFSRQNRQDIAKQFKTETVKTGDKKQKIGSLFIFGQACGAISAFLVYYAIAIAHDLAVVNATRGLEYVFLFILVATLSHKYPRLLAEKLTPKIMTQKITAIVLIIAGLIILAYA